MDVPYHPPPEDIDHTPYTDLKISELPGKLDWSWKMRHGIIDIKGFNNLSKPLYNDNIIF